MCYSLRPMLAVELMKTHVVKISERATLSEAIDLMDLYQTSALPVVDSDDRLCGILTETDVMRLVFPEPFPTDMVSPFNLLSGSVRRIGVSHVCDYMQSGVVFVMEDCELADVAKIMIQNRLKRVPVLTQDRQVVGMLNRVDVIQAIFEGLLSL